MNIQQSCSTLCINIGFDHRDLSICRAVGRVLLFVRAFIFALSFEATRSFSIFIACILVMIIARRGLEVKVIGHG